MLIRLLLISILRTYCASLEGTLDSYITASGVDAFVNRLESAVFIRCKLDPIANNSTNGANSITSSVVIIENLVIARVLGGSNRVSDSLDRCVDLVNSALYFSISLPHV